MTENKVQSYSTKLGRVEIGIIISASYIAGSCDQPTYAANLLHEFHVTKKMINLADIYDRKILLPLYDSESILINMRD